VPANTPRIEARKILATKYVADTRPIASGNRGEVDALVSWNFRHKVRLEKIRLFNTVKRRIVSWNPDILKS
jgi:hypothetical protein